MGDLWRDVWFGARSLLKRPGITWIAVLTLAFRAMGVRLLRGRVFDAHDNAKTNSVVIIDERFAQEAFGKEDPLGKRVAVTGTLDKPIWSTIVGVVAHVKNYGVDQPSHDEAYLCNDQASGGGGSVVLKTSGDLSSFVGALREVFRAENPDVPVARIRSLSSIVDDSTAQRRLSVTLLGIFASIALLLAAIGLYGVMSYSVTQRAHEIGVRVALGAERGDVLRMVLGNGSTLVGIGVACGLAGSLARGAITAGATLRSGIGGLPDI